MNSQSGLEVLDEAVKEAYISHPLRLTGFAYGRCRKGQPQPIVSVVAESLEDLKKMIGRARLLVIPNRPLDMVQKYLCIYQCTF